MWTNFSISPAAKTAAVAIQSLRLSALADTLSAPGNGSQVRRNGRIVLFGLTAAQNRDVGILEDADGLWGILHANLHPLAQQVNLHHSTAAFGGIHKGFQLGAGADQVFVGILLIFQAAHQAAAGAGNLGGIQGQILGLGHFDGHRLEVLQEAGTAEGPAADTQAAHHLSLVPDADLPQFNAGVEHGGQVLHQFPEVHPLIGGEIEQDFAAVKAIIERAGIILSFTIFPFSEKKVLTSASAQKTSRT